jgi:capsular exopolysaccharide synthesis family protein
MQSTESPDLDFQKLWLALKRRWLPGAAVFVVMVGLAIPVALWLKPSYEAKGKLLFKLNRTSSLTGVGQDIGELNPVTATNNPITTELEIIRSIPLAQETIAALKLKDGEGKPIKPEKFLNKLKAKSVSGADVVGLSYKSHDPKEAAAIVNKLMTLYITNNVRNNRAEAVAAQEFINTQLPKAEATVNQAEAALQQFKEKNQVIALDEEAKSAVRTVAELEQQLTQVQAALKEANARSIALQDKVGMNSQQAINISSLSVSPGVQEVLKEFQKVEAQLTVQRTRFLDDNPIIVSLKEKEAALKTLLEERITQTLGSQQQVSTGNLQMGEVKEELTSDFVKAEVERLSLASRLAELSNAQSAYKQRLNILPKLEKDQRELQRRLDAAQSTYETLLKKLQEVQVAENQNIGNARIAEPALVPEKPSIKGKAIIILFGVVMGTLFSMATIIILEVRDTSLKTLKEVRELFEYTLIGNIPTFGKKTRSRAKHQERTIPELPVRDTPRAPISEAYRMLQANLKFLSSDKPPKVIVVTSSVPQEGKSTVSANLAAAMAQLGRRVLLVDADLRHPMQHHIWKLTNAAGLSDVLVGQADFEAVVTEGMDNLDVLSSGVIPPNPLALLDSKRMASLIEYFSEHYDFVIIDAPPLVVAADALTLGKMTDGVLLVARPMVVDSISVAACKELLERSGQNVLGLVANGVSLENKSDRYFHYYGKEYSAGYSSTIRGKVTFKS